MMSDAHQSVKPAYLVLADGTVYEGYAMGKEGKALGEVVFNTNMTTYQGILKDPTYAGQIVVQTYPLIGNRGVDPAPVSRIRASGFIVREWCEEPTDAAEFITLNEYLEQNNIVGLCGIDTRALTRRIRRAGVMNGAITDSLDEMSTLIAVIRDYRVHPNIGKTSVQRTVRYEAENPRFELAAPDYGFNHDFLEPLRARGCSVTVYPSHTPAAEMLQGRPDGILLPDGPGDPWDNPDIASVVGELMDAHVPILAYGLGHQLMAVAAGLSIEKLPVGHRGANQSVRRLRDGRIMTTVQNHGYTVATGAVDESVAVPTLRNVNDGTLEGLFYPRVPAVSVQFEPSDGHPIQDTAWVFDEFVALLEGGTTHA